MQLMQVQMQMQKFQHYTQFTFVTSIAKNITKLAEMAHWWDDTNAVDTGPNTDRDTEISTLYTLHICNIYS